MLKTLVVATDGSEVGERALADAIDLAGKLDADLHVVHVIQAGLYPSLFMDNIISPGIPADPAQQAVYEMLEREAEEILARAADRAAAAGVRITTHRQFGDPGSEIVALAGEADADLIIVGSRGKSGIDRFFLGSVSSFVVEHSPVATLVIRA